MASFTLDGVSVQGIAVAVEKKLAKADVNQRWERITCFLRIWTHPNEVW